MARTASKDSKPKILKVIPNSEEGKVECLNGQYLITYNNLKEQSTLWKRLEEGFEKIKTSENPLDFDKIIPW
jgi:hypothetical protein